MFSDDDTVAPATRPPMAVTSYGLTDRGQKRETNEDCFAIAELARTLQIQHTSLPQPGNIVSLYRGHVFLIADGVGGSNAGEVASGLGVASIEDFMLNTLRRFFKLEAHEEQAALRALQDALREADSRIFREQAKHPEWHGMGTTLTMAFAVNWRLFVAHAGDSRCYLWSGGKLQQLTKDHTLPAELARQGIIPESKVAEHPWRHVITNVLGGTKPGVQVEVHSLDLHADDVLLLCSDGLSEMVPDEQIADVLEREADPQRACERLVADANGSGGKDNITVIAARFSNGG